MTQILKINDAGWLFAETFRTPMQLGVLANFSMPDDADDCYLEDLVAHTTANGLAIQKTPEQLEVLDALPRNPTGKVLKFELRDRFQG